MSGAQRKAIPQAVQSAVLVANRHACCVCQQPRVQLHHIDGDPSNNDPSNIAAVCLTHHDMASMVIGLTKKLQPDQVRHYKATWEASCARDIWALSRERFTFHYCVYKNPPRIREALMSLPMHERRQAVARIQDALIDEQDPKDRDDIWGYNLAPATTEATKVALTSLFLGEDAPSYLPIKQPHPEDPYYPFGMSTQEAMTTFHHYDLWCQVACQVLAAARGSLPLEDIYDCETEDETDGYAGRLVNFRLSIRGAGIKVPRMWKTHPTSSIRARAKRGDRAMSVKMALRTMYLFSDTAAINLRSGRVSGLGIFSGATENPSGGLDLTVVPLLIGTGGWITDPQHYPKDFATTRTARTE